MCFNGQLRALAYVDVASIDVRTSAHAVLAPGSREIEMSSHIHTWGLVLAAGEGRGLQSLTATAGGVPVPKQYCSLYGGPTLLQAAMLRASQITPMEFVCAVVAAQHRNWWQAGLSHLPTGNVFVQPDDRGTAHGVLLPLAHILMRDANAVVVVLPADHHVEEEHVLSDSINSAITLARSSLRTVYLLGIEPDEADTELAYIVPAQRARDGSARVSQLIEKPAPDQVRNLVKDGALRNAFIVVGTARALVALFEKRFVTTIMDMLTVSRRSGNVSLGFSTAARVYKHLSTVDFFGGVLQGQETKLRVLPVSKCGWTDLDTPGHVAQAVRRLPTRTGMPDGDCGNSPRVNLAIEHSRRQLTHGRSGTDAKRISA